VIFRVLAAPAHHDAAFPGSWARGYTLAGHVGGALTSGERSGGRGAALLVSPKRGFRDFGQNVQVT